MTLIYKIVSHEIWQRMAKDGVLIGMPVDLADGYIHFSAADQLRATAVKHFAGQTGLQLLAVDPVRLGAALRWEVSRGGALFPHLYASLALGDVALSIPLPLNDAGMHLFPEGIP